MASKSNARLASNKQVSTKWLENAMKSIGVSTKNVLKNDLTPNIYEAVSSGVSTSKSVVNSLRTTMSGQNNISRQLQNNKYVKFAEKAYKNALMDIKAGNFNNEDRAANAMMGGDDFSFDDFDFDSGFSFDDDGADSGDVNILNVAGNNDAVFAMTSQLQKQSEATLRTSQANMNAMIAINSASMMQTQQIGSQIIEGLTSINQNLSSLVEYNNSNMTKFIESSMAFYERMGSKLDDDSYSYGNEKIKGNQVFNNASGGINFSSYKRYVQQQFKDTLTGTGLGAAASLVSDDMIEMMIANPLGFASEGLVSLVMPKVLASTMGSVEQAFSAFGPALLQKIGSWGDEYGKGIKGNIKQFIGKTFGIKIDRKEKIDKAASIKQGPIPFDGQTKHAITEIITKELREQTSYLKAIAGHYGIDTDKAKNNADVFDYKTGKYMNVSDVTQQILTEIKESTVNTMKSGAFGKELVKAQAALYDKNGNANEGDLKAMNAMIDELLLRLEKHGTTLSLTDKDFKDKDSDYSKIMASLSGDKSIKKILDTYFQGMTKRNPTAANDLARTIITGNSARNNALKDIQENPLEYNLYAALGLDGKTIDELLLPDSNNKEKKEKEPKAKQPKSIMGKRITSKRVNNMINNADSSNATLSNYGTGELNGEKSTFDYLVKRGGDGLINTMSAIINGSSDQAFNAIGSMIADQSKAIWDKFRDNIVNPLKITFFGTKDGDGFIRNGIFSSLQNSFKDSSLLLMHHITGKSFKDSAGKMHDETDDSVVGSFQKIGTEIKNTVLEKLFGKKIFDDDGNPTGETKGGLLKGFNKTINDGLVGWQEALFGKKLSDDEKTNLKDSMTKNLNERMPASLTGSAVGAGISMMAGGKAGSLLGFLVGGPIAGAALGSAVGFASKSDKLQDWLFGKKDKDEKRTGGFISKEVQNFFKENKGVIAGSSVAGTVAGAITGGGVLGTIVGGPVAGALLGMSAGIVAKSKMFQEFLSGDEKTGQKGIIQSFNDVFGRHKGDEQIAATLGGKAVGMSLLGAGAGALTAGMISHMGILGAALTPLGPVGGALVGLGLGIRAQKDNFNKWLFGEKDKDGNRTKEGILGQFRNMLSVSVLSPLKAGMENFVDDAKLFVKYEILDTIRMAVEPIGDVLMTAASGVKNGVISLFNKIGGGIQDIFINPIVDKVNDIIIAPIRGVVTGVSKVAWGMTKKMVSIPFDIVNNVVGIIKSPILKALGVMKKLTIDPIVKTVDKHILQPIKGVFNGLFKRIGFVANTIIKKPLNFIGGAANYLGGKMLNVGGEYQEVEDQGGIIDSHEGQRKARKKQKKIEYANARKAKHDRELRIKNQIAIAKATNYQLTEDTRENRDIAKDAGAKIDESISVVESSKKSSTKGKSEAEVLGAKFEDLDPEAQQVQLLSKIFNVLSNTANDDKKDSSKSNDDKNDSSKSNDTNTDNDDKSNDSSNKNGDAKISDVERIANEINDAGGLFGYTKSKLHGARERASSFFDRGKNIASEKLGKMKGLIDRFKGRGFANGGTVNSDEAVMVGEGEPELVNLSAGDQVYANSRPLQVTIVGIAKGVSGIFKSAFSGVKNKLAGDEKATPDSNDIVSSSLKLGAIGAKASGVVSSIANGFSNRGASEKDQEAYEDSLNTAATIADADSRYDDAVDKGYTADEQIAKKEEEEQKAHLANIDDGIENQNNTQNKFSSIWSSIFGKKGLITGLALIGVPLLIKFLKNFSLGGIANVMGSLLSTLASTVGSFIDTAASTIGNAISSLSFVHENGGLGDSDTSEDKAEEDAERIENIAKGNLSGFVLNEDNNWDHMSGANAKFATKFGAMGIAGLAGLGNKGLAVKDIASNGFKMLTGTADDASKEAAKAAAATLKNQTTKSGASTLIDFGKNNIKSGFNNLMNSFGKTSIDDVAEAAGKTTIETTTSAAETVAKNSEGLLAKVISKITSLFDDFVKLVSKKCGKKIGSTVVGKLLKQVIECVSKNFGKIATPIAAVLEMTAGLAVTGVGLLAKEATWITLGAINGLSGTARLFRVDNDYVDTLMTLISGVLGGFNGSTVGSIVDIVNELVCSITGVDVYTELATLVYNFIAGEDNAEKLRGGREEFQNSYLDYQNDTLKDQYDTLVKSQQIDADHVSFDDYVAGAKDGTYKAKYDSFSDYNDKQHKTLGSNVGAGLASIGKGIKKGVLSIGAFFTGEKSEYYEDGNGNKYYDNENGTYEIYDKNGKDLGYISKDALPKGATLNTKTTSNIIDRAGAAMSSGWNSLSTGASKMAQSAGASISSGWNSFYNNATDFGNNVANGAKNAWDSTIKFANDFGASAAKGAKNFFTHDMTTGYLSSDGSYYDGEGKHFSATGDEIGNDIDLATLSALISNGTLIETDIVTRQAGIFQLKDNVIKAFDDGVASVKEGFNSFISGVKTFGKSVVKGAHDIYKNATTTIDNAETAVHDFFMSHTEKVWYDSNGCYYKSDGNTFSYYSANGDKLQEKVSTKFVTSLASSGALIEGEVKEKSGLATIADDVVYKSRSAIKTGLEKGKYFIDKVEEKADAVIDTATKTVASASKSVHDFFMSHTEKAWYDSNGCYYVSNGNGFDYYNANGSKISEDVDADKVTALINSNALTEGEVKEKSGLATIADDVVYKSRSAIKSGLEKGKYFIDKVEEKADAVIDTATKTVASASKSVHDFFFSHTEKAWFDTKHGYYLSNGETFDYYNSNGDKIAEKIDSDDVAALLNSGALTEGTVTKDSTIKEGINTLSDAKDRIVKNIFTTASNAWDSISSTASNLWESIRTGKIVDDVVKFFSDSSSTAWFDPNGNYYVLKGSTYEYYNANNDLLAKNIDAKVVQDKKNAGLLTKGTIQKDSAAKNAISQIQSSVKSAWDKAKSVVSTNWTNFVNWLSGSDTTSGGYGGGYGSGSFGFNKSSYGTKSSLGSMRSVATYGGYGRGRRRRFVVGGRGTTYPKYSDLTDANITDIAKMITGETGGDDELAAQQEASQLANLNEVTRKRSATAANLYKTLHSGWYSKGSWTRGKTQTAVNAVKSVLINGNRVLPRYVTEHDMFPLDAAIKGHWSNGKNENRSQYTKHNTTINQNPSRFSNPASYKFYTFFGKNGKGDVAGYYPKDYEKYKTDEPVTGDSSTATTTSTTATTAATTGSTGTTSILDRIGTFFSNFGNAALEGVLTGNYDGSNLLSSDSGTPTSSSTPITTTSTAGMPNGGAAISGAEAVIKNGNYYDKALRDAYKKDEVWVYSNKNKYTKQRGYFEDMLNKAGGAKYRGGNCASLANWAYRDMGIISSNEGFYGAPGTGKIAHYHTYGQKIKSKIDKYCDVINYEKEGTPKFSTLLKNGKVKPGDIIMGKGHTFIYRGNNTFFASGHDGRWHKDNRANSEDKRHSRFETWISTTSQAKSDMRFPVHYLMRTKPGFTTTHYRNGGSGVGYGGRGSLPYYSQNDPKWENSAYGNDGATMGDSGCGPAAMAMVTSGLTGQNVSPTEMANFSNFIGTRDSSGTNANFIGAAANSYGLDSEQMIEPSANDIYDAASYGPLVLLGQNHGGNNPYTSAGHYVVTDGVDGSGNINIKDPRGASYNKKYNVSDLADATGSMWGFGTGYGGYGESIKNKYKNTTETLGGRGNTFTAADIVAIALNEVGYLEKKSKSQLDEKTANPGHNEWTKYASPIGHGVAAYWCATFVCWCFYTAAGNDKKKAKEVLCDAFSASCSINVSYFKKANRFVSANKLPQVGYIIYYTRGHTGIVTSVESDGKTYHTVEGNTSDDSKKYSVNGVFTKTRHVGDSGILGFGSPKYDGTSSFSGVTNSDSTTSTTDVTTTVTETPASTFDKVVDWVGEFANRAVNGALTGNYDTDWGSYWSGTTTTTPTTTTTTTTPDTSSSGTYSGSTNAEKIWSYLKNKGIPDNGIAGLMGNLQAESNLQFNNAENAYEKYTGDDVTYTRNIDSGKVTKNQFLHPWGGTSKSGYGLAQWTTPTRKSGLWDLVKGRNVSIADAGAQMDWLWSELSKSYPSVLSTMKDSSKTIRQVSDKVLINFEAPPTRNNESTQSTRASKGQSIYNKYHGGSGNGRSSIVPRIIRQNGVHKNIGGFGISSEFSLLNSGYNNDFSTVSSAQKYINRSGELNTSQALVAVIGLLEQITGNTATTSNKLDMLNNIRNSNVIVGGGTTNTYVSNKSGNSTDVTSKVLSTGVGNKASRNQRLAERIATGL